MNFILCIHNHQPVGNMDFVLERAYEKAYWPFLELLCDYPEIKINMHISGYLLLFLLKKEEYVKKLKDLVSRGQIELMGGGMYEPVFSLIPLSDAVEQIEMHKRKIKEVFGVVPKGLWLPERVYEPHFPLFLSKAGISYTLVDDNHFLSLGLEEKDLYGYFLTEFEGERLYLFPGLKFLRYAIPFKNIEEIERYFKEKEGEGAELLVFGDDGEKFGLWPGTHKHVYEDRWLESFFSFLRDNEHWIKTRTFSEYMEMKGPKSLIYLDCNSYREMGEWAYPAKAVDEYLTLLERTEEKTKPFIRGGYFKYFLTKYAESNDMHKRMLEVSKKVKKRKAKEYLFLAQCNDAYWHGIFGGLYLPHLRSTVYSNLIKAENIEKGKGYFPSATLSDVNFDGVQEGILESEYLKAYFYLKEGGVLYELDYKPSAVNLMANLTRRYEGYHEKIKDLTLDVANGKKTIHEMVLAKEENLASFIFYDWYRRASLIDHVMGKDLDFESFYRGTYIEPGDFVKEEYKGDVYVKKGSARIEMKREGNFWIEGRGIPLSIMKGVEVRKGERALYIDYSLQGEIPSFFFGIEFNFSFLALLEGRYLESEEGRFPLTFKGILKPSSSILLYDHYQNVKITLSMDRPFSIWTFPVETVSLSEEGFERNYQCTMIMPVWKIEDLSRGKRLHLEILLDGLGNNPDL